MGSGGFLKKRLYSCVLIYKASDLATDILAANCLEWGRNIVFIQIGGNDVNCGWTKGEINNKVDEINKKKFALIEIYLDRGIHVLLGEVLPRELHGFNCIQNVMNRKLRRVMARPRESDSVLTCTLEQDLPGARGSPKGVQERWDTFQRHS